MQHATSAPLLGTPRPHAPTGSNAHGDAQAPPAPDTAHFGTATSTVRSRVLRGWVRVGECNYWWFYGFRSCSWGRCPCCGGCRACLCWSGWCSRARDAWAGLLGVLMSSWPTRGVCARGTSSGPDPVGMSVQSRRGDTHHQTNHHPNTEDLATSSHAPVLDHPNHLPCPRPSSPCIWPAQREDGKGSSSACPHNRGRLTCGRLLHRRRHRPAPARSRLHRPHHRPHLLLPPAAGRRGPHTAPLLAVREVTRRR